MAAVPGGDYLGEGYIVSGTWRTIGGPQARFDALLFTTSRDEDAEGPLQDPLFFQRDQATLLPSMAEHEKIRR